MRIKTLLWLLSLVSYRAYAQDLSGTYESRQTRGSVLFEYEQFRFAGSRFFYSLNGCTGVETGYGTFSLVSDSLTLHFEDSTAAFPKVSRAQCMVPGYCCTVLDAATRQPIAGATVLLCRYWPEKTLETFTDEEGRVAFSDGVRAASLQPDSCLAVAALGYLPITIALPSDLGRGFTVLLSAKGIAAGTVHRYKLYPAQIGQLALTNGGPPQYYQQLTEQRKRELARSNAKQEKATRKMRESRGR